MKKPEVFLKPVPKDIIELAKDHTRMTVEIRNLLFLILELEKGKNYDWILNKSTLHSEVGYIAEQLKKVYNENKALKEEIINLKESLAP
jgi:hypothetical protein